MGLFVLCVACLTVFVNCLVKQFAICLGVVVILVLNVMEVLSVGGGALLDRTYNGLPKNWVTTIFRSFHRTASSTTGGWSRWNILMCFFYTSF